MGDARYGIVIAVTNGDGHVRSVRDLVESAVVDSDPGWRMLDPAARTFSLESAADQLATAFPRSRSSARRTPDRWWFTTPTVITDYLVSFGDLYGPALNQPWPTAVAAVGRQVRDFIDREGHFLTRVAHPAAALCSPVQRSPGLRDGVPTVQPRRPVNRPVTPIENGETTSRASRA